MKRVGKREDEELQKKSIWLAQTVAAGAYGVQMDDMCSRTRKGEAEKARQLAAYLARVVFDVGLRELAIAMGRSPGTVCHACRRVEQRREEPQFDFAVEYLEHQLRSAATGAAA
ncbi:MAG TPA: helix-turn-helix domain-containing protein [Rhizomicrobium sp.]|nr:helix-turn-helix domain-containing protein [Rhizomicrobium sp.]